MSFENRSSEESREAAAELSAYACKTFTEHRGLGQPSGEVCFGLTGSLRIILWFLDRKLKEFVVTWNTSDGSQGVDTISYLGASDIETGDFRICEWTVTSAKPDAEVGPIYTGISPGLVSLMSLHIDNCVASGNFQALDEGATITWETSPGRGPRERAQSG